MTDGDLHQSADIAAYIFKDNDNDDGINLSLYHPQEQKSREGEGEQQQNFLTRVVKYGNHTRPLYSMTKNKIPIVRHRCKLQNCRLLKTYQSNAMYLCTSDEFQRMIDTFFQETNAYYRIEESNSSTKSYSSVSEMLDCLVEKVNDLLHELRENQSISFVQYQNMKVHRASVQLDHLYFVPDTRRKHPQVVVQPMMISRTSPIVHIARLLYRLLKPIYQQVALKQTFGDGADAIEALEAYMHHGHLRSNTFFVCLHVRHILTLFPHEEAIRLVEEFLHTYVPSNEIQGITIGNIIELLRFVLANQWFLYENKLYRQRSGGHCTIPLMSLLVNIILFDWERELVGYLQARNEIYGRCFDEIFFTWNESEATFEQWIKQMQMKKSYIDIQSTIDKQIDYLDAHVHYFSSDQNDNRLELETQVHHQSNAEPHSLPYIDHHSLHHYGKLFRAALIRAVRCCSNVYDFQSERQMIELSFVLNRFSMDFIREQIYVFFLEFDFDDDYYLSYDYRKYEQLREHVRNYHDKCREAKNKHQVHK